MKRFRPFAVPFAALATLCVATSPLLAQGALTPPAAPGPMFKTLAQIEPRTPLVAGSPGVDVSVAGTITITAPGSYYLTGPIVKTGNNYTVIIAASQVALDLGGFTISSDGSPYGSAIRINNALSGITIRNGVIRGNGFVNGIAFENHTTGQVYPAMVRVSDIVVDSVAQDGIDIAADAQSEAISCHVRNAFRNGILAGSVRYSSSVGAGQVAIGGSTVIGSKGVGGLSGILAQVVSESQGTSLNGAPGIDATVVTNSIGISDSDYGILATNVTNCTGRTVNAPVGSNTSGIKASGSVQNSYGESGATGIPIHAQIAIGCTFAGANPPQIAHRYNMPATP